MASFLKLVNGIPTTTEYVPTVYSQAYNVNSDLSSGVPVTLPSSGTYTSDELKVYVDGKRNYVTVDYSYVGSPPRTQVSFTYDVKSGSVILFEKLS